MLQAGAAPQLPLCDDASASILPSLKMRNLYELIKSIPFVEIMLTEELQLDYAKGSPERAELTKTIKRMKSAFPLNIPISISGATVCTIPFLNIVVLIQ